MATFHSKDVKLQLDVAVEDSEDSQGCPTVKFERVQRNGLLGDGLVARLHIYEGQTVSFVLRNDKPDHITKDITALVLDEQQHATQTFWYNFISQSKYTGRWMEVVTRSLMILKMLTYGAYSLASVSLLNIHSFRMNTDTVSKNQPEQLLPPRHSPSLRTLAINGIGITDIAGYEIPVSPSTSYFDLVSEPRQMHT